MRPDAPATSILTLTASMEKMQASMAETEESFQKLIHALAVLGGKCRTTEATKRRAEQAEWLTEQLAYAYPARIPCTALISAARSTRGISTVGLRQLSKDLGFMGDADYWRLPDDHPLACG